jgi:hypothetical protein
MHELERVVIDFDPVSVGVLQVDLFHLVGADLRSGRILGPVAVFHMFRFKVFRKGVHRGDAEGEVNIDIVGDIGCGAGDDMQLAVFRDPEPDVFAIVKGFGYPLEFQNLLIEVRGAVQVRDEDGLVTEAGALCVGGEGHHHRQHQDQAGAEGAVSAWKYRLIHK